MLHRSHTWAHFALILVVVLLSLSVVSAQDQPKPEAVGLRPDAPTYALHGPYWVGMMEMEAETDLHPTIVQLWYPALNPKGRKESVTQLVMHWGSTAPFYGHALQNAEPDRSGGSYPLVIFVHGLMGSRLASIYLAEHLASQGFMVMAINYADNHETGTGVNPALSMYTRPKDVTWQIDYAEQLNSDTKGKWQGMIDLEHVAVTGHSYGGYTTFVVGGALLDLSGSTSWCLQYPDLPLPPEIGNTTFQKYMCDFAPDVADMAGIASVPEGVWPSWADPRIDAIIPLAPLPLFGAESTAEVTIPTLLMYGDKDHLIFGNFPLYEPYLYENLGSTMKAQVVFSNADHMIFGNACVSAPWLAGAGLFWVCSDPVWEMDRAHDLINHFTTAFLLDVLKGDKDARAALAPDAVSFPGIEYQAQGF